MCASQALAMRMANYFSGSPLRCDRRTNVGGFLDRIRIRRRPEENGTKEDYAPDPVRQSSYHLVNPPAFESLKLVGPAATIKPADSYIQVPGPELWT